MRSLGSGNLLGHMYPGQQTQDSVPAAQVPWLLVEAWVYGTAIKVTVSTGLGQRLAAQAALPRQRARAPLYCRGREGKRGMPHRCRMTLP